MQTYKLYIEIAIDEKNTVTFFSVFKKNLRNDIFDKRTKWKLQFLENANEDFGVHSTKNYV